MHKEISDFLESLSPDDRDEVMRYYGGESKAKEWAFRSALEPHAQHVNFHTLNFRNDDIEGYLRAISQTDSFNSFCAASIPSSSGTADGHSIALVFDHEHRSILFHDPYGAPPLALVSDTLKRLFPSYILSHSNLAQQQDDNSCALITALNLAAYASGREPDPFIQDKLMDIRLNHAPALLSIKRDELQGLLNKKSAPCTAQNLRRQRWENACKDPTTRTLVENFSRLSDSPEIKPAFRFLIIATRAQQQIAPEEPQNGDHPHQAVN